MVYVGFFMSQSKGDPGAVVSVTYLFKTHGQWQWRVAVWGSFSPSCGPIHRLTLFTIFGVVSGDGVLEDGPLLL